MKSTDVMEIDKNTLRYIQTLMSELRHLEDLLRDEANNDRIELLVSPSPLETKKRRLENMVNEEKAELVRQCVHISHHEPTDANPKNFYYAFIGDSAKIGGRRKITASTEKDLIDKIFLIMSSGGTFTGNLTNATFKEMFDAGYERKVAGNCTENTLRKIRADYARFITGADFENKKLRFIDDIDIMKHTKALLDNNDLNKSAFMAYKGILNIAFDLAVDKHIIDSSPAKMIGNTNYYSLLKETHRVRSDGSTIPDGSDGKILSDEEIESLKSLAWADINRRYANYAYATVVSILTGMRSAELFSLRWDDIDFDSEEMWIHSQQLCTFVDGRHIFEYVPWTKNERKLRPEMRRGRRFPLYEELRETLLNLKAEQEERGIKCEYVFCNEKGAWGNTRNYERYLKNKCEELGFKVTNNHALRMALNSNVFIVKLDMPVTMRAELLGHSEEVNLSMYSHRPKDYLERTADAFKKLSGNSITHKNIE